LKEGTRRQAPAGPYLLDTHIWFWHLSGTPRVPDGLRAALDGSEAELWLSPISVWELGMLAERGRVRLKTNVRAWVEEAHRRFPLRDAALTREVAVVSHELSLPHRDPADRFLAATAIVHGLTLMTVDERLRRARWLATRST